MPDRTLLIAAAPDGAITLFNRNCEALTGLSETAMLGRPFWEVAADTASRERMAAAFRALVQPEAGVSQTTGDEGDGVWIAGDGQPRSIHWSCSALRDPQGQLLSILLTGVDVSRVRRIQNELGEAIDRQQAILDTAVDGIITIGEGGLIESFNRAAERIFGYRAGEVVGRNVSMLMPAHYAEEHDQYLDNYLTTRRKRVIGTGREVEGRRKDGNVFPMELAVGAAILPGGRTFTGIVRDITDRREAEHEARRRLNELAHVMRLRSMGDLASGLSHEVNQPLTAIVSHAQACVRIIDAGGPDLDLLRESLKQIAHQGQRAGEVIRRLRRFVEKGELEMRRCDVNASITEVLALLRHELDQFEVRVQVQAAASLPAVDMDRVQIEQVVVNLVRNAIDALAVRAPGDRLLRVATTAAADGGVEVWVADNGPGFGEVAAGQLFEPFFTTKAKGLGQGLSICRHIIEAHGGWIRAVNGPPGGHSDERTGAVFHFRLPPAAAI